jgi:hypothetical protein
MQGFRVKSAVVNVGGDPDDIADVPATQIAEEFSKLRSPPKW